MGRLAINLDPYKQIIQIGGRRYTNWRSNYSRRSTPSLFLLRYENQFLSLLQRNLMGKKLRSKPKNRGSRRQINTQGCEGQIITQESEGQTHIEGCEVQLFTQESEGQIFTQDFEGEIIAQDYEGGIIAQVCEPKNISQDSDSQIVTHICEGQMTTQGFDCINEDGILCSIISSLPIKEAVRTCVLSHRWKHIWKSLPILNFDIETVLDDGTLALCEGFRTAKDKCYLLLVKTDQFIQSIDSVLQQHQGRGRVRVESFVVRYFLYKPHSHYLDEWVRFVVASQTKMLYLHLEQIFSYFNVELYDFPFHLLGSSSIEELYLAYCSVKLPYQIDGLNHLKILGLWHSDATAEDINCILSNCSTIQKLGVVGSKELTILSIPHSLSQLNHFAVKECDHLMKIEIDAINISHMCYEGVPVDFVLRRPSCVKKAKIYFKTEGKDHDLNFYLTKLAKDLPNLQFLNLNVTGFSKVEYSSKCSSSFIHLKRLDWECPQWSVGVKMSLLHLDILLDAAPFVEELKLHLSTCGVEESPPRLTKLKKRLLLKRDLSHLKTVEISGFYFERWQLQIILYLLNSAIGLESMTLEKGREPLKEIEERDMRSLTQQVPPNVKLVIL